jgi:hypothetical protein
VFDWAVAELPAYTDTTRWLLARRCLTRDSKGEYEIAYYLCCAPTGTTDGDLVRVAVTAAIAPKALAAASSHSR